MQIPIPVFYKGKEIYDQCEVQKPKSGNLADTLEIHDTQGSFPAIMEFNCSAIKSFTSVKGEIVNDKVQIRAICRWMSFQSAEVISTEAMKLIETDGWIEAVYQCPRCGKKIVSGVDSGIPEDMRDKIDDLEIINQGENEVGQIDVDKYSNIVRVDLVEPIQIKNAVNGEVQQEINSFEMRYPNMDDCIKGSAKFGNKKAGKTQLAIYAQAIEKINKEPVTAKWKKMWSEYIMGLLDPDDISVIHKEMQKYGMKKSLPKVCRECGKEWNAPVSTSNFFASGLRSM